MRGRVPEVKPILEVPRRRLLLRLELFEVVDRSRVPGGIERGHFAVPEVRVVGPSAEPFLLVVEAPLLVGVCLVRERVGAAARRCALCRELPPWRTLIATVAREAPAQQC